MNVKLQMLRLFHLKLGNFSMSKLLGILYFFVEKYNKQNNICDIAKTSFSRQNKGYALSC